MKKHVLWLALAVATFVVATAYMMRRKPEPIDTPSLERVKPLASKSPFAPPPNQAAPALPKPVIAVENGKAVDLSRDAVMSAGVAPEKAFIQRSVQEMEATLRNAPPPAERK